MAPRTSLFSDLNNLRKDVGSNPEGLEDVLSNPMLGLRRAARELGVLPSTGIAAGPVADFLRQRAGLAQRQFLLRQALGGGSLAPDAFQDFQRGFVRGFFGGAGSPSAYATFGELPNLLNQLRGASTGSVDATSNPALAALLNMAQEDPAEFADTVFSLFEPHLGPLARYLRGLFEDAAASFLEMPMQDRQRNNFVVALLNSLGSRQLPATGNLNVLSR